MNLIGMNRALALLSIVVLSACISISAKADTLGLFAGVGFWTSTAEGEVNNRQTTLETEDDLGFDSESFAQGYLAFEHFVPLIPNLRVQYVDLGSEGENTLSMGFNDQAFDGTVKTELDLTETDFIVYWRLLDNVLNLDIGAQLSILDGEFSMIQGADAEVVATIDKTLPLIYASAGVDLPLTGLSATLSGAAVSFDGEQVMDLNLRLNYELNIVGAELGWRTHTIELDDQDGLEFNLDYAGPYLGINLHF